MKIETEYLKLNVSPNVGDSASITNYNGITITKEQMRAAQDRYDRNIEMIEQRKIAREKQDNNLQVCLALLMIAICLYILTFKAWK